MLRPGGEYAVVHDTNFGENVGEWEPRSRAAVALLLRHAAELGARPSLADWGCGRQTVRRLIPAGWRYAPYDHRIRSPDTRLVDFNREVPGEPADVILCLGVLEYLDDYWGVLAQAIARSRYCLFSYVGPADEARRRLNGWKADHPFSAVDDFLARLGAERIATLDAAEHDRIYLVRGGRR